MDKDIKRVHEMITELNRLEETVHRVLLLLSGEMNEIEKTCSRLHNELLEDGVKITEKLNTQTG